MACSVCRVPAFDLSLLPPFSEITREWLTGTPVFPWGRLGPEIRKDLVLAQKSEKEGGTGIAEKFWDWCDQQVKTYT